MVCDSLIDESAGTLGYVINRRMVGLREAGTFRMSNDVASKVGRDESIYGYMASALLNDAGVVPVAAPVPVASVLTQRDCPPVHSLGPGGLPPGGQRGPSNR